MKSRKRRDIHTEPENFWPSFTDMISTIAIILFFLMFLMYINNIIAGKDLEFLRKELQDTDRRLEASRLEISQAEKNLRLLETELDQTMAEVEAGQLALTLSREEIEEQRDIIANSNEELGNLRSKLQGIAILRLDVLNAVKDSVESVLGKTNQAGEPLVLISDNGSIVINEGVLFDRASYTIKPDGEKLLAQLALAFEAVLDDSETRASIDAINIQGHTDERGEGDYNRELGAMRSTSVVNFLMQSNPNLESTYSDYFMASTYSEYRPVDDRQTEAAYAKNRRIEIGIILKDSHVQDVIDTYLNDAMDAFNESND
ncbi:OmpA family protein [Fusibacter tunisiensis]|uniref:Chemotaxis protein MotB n=1 Tax=Fusibacter tunisiensis TaxID=1008308 RepID=A0ABS2MS36_9FIRM|nr:OmpA family protein [Fusibacter tunisiensis]MBM7562239.1 chemotaxis protein MotB [Fusibacter tunisiensis]